MKTIKGFDKNLQCRGYQYEVGKTYECDGDIEVCKKGFHAISEDASPLTVFNYYPPTDEKGNLQRYCEVEAEGTVKRDGDKIACSKLTVGAEIGIPGLVKAHVEWVKAHVTNENNADKGEPATAGDSGAATAGDSGAATAGYSGTATAGDSGAATAGDRGAATAGDSGAATAGDSGAATAGDSGAATAGYSGTATAGAYGAATAGYSGTATAGYSGAATAGDSGAATAGDSGTATAGYSGAATSRGKSSVGEQGVAVARGTNIKVKGGLGAVIVAVVENNNDYNISEWKSAVVDGERIKADTWYTLKDGEFVEVGD